MSNKNTTDEMIACIQAWQRGEMIEIETRNGWFVVDPPQWNFQTSHYRIAPSRKRRSCGHGSRRKCRWGRWCAELA